MDNKENFYISEKKRPGDVWYFAYGSNININQKECRTGEIRESYVCRLDGYRFTFDKPSTRTGDFYANIRENSERHVWGVGYLCDVPAMLEMDRWEGSAYKRCPVVVRNLDNQLINAEAYIYDPKGVKNQIEHAPTEEYYAKIRKGMRSHSGFPDDYVEWFEEHYRKLREQGDTT
jgi:cation transport regulator ChaC